MNQVSYNPKELLTVLIEVETQLKSTINKNYPEREISLSEDLDQALEEFLKQQSLRDNDVGYLSSQMALFHLCREFEKTIGVIIDSNDLRAFHDFRVFMGSDYKEPAIIEKEWKTREMLSGMLIGVALVSLVMFFVW